MQTLYTLKTKETGAPMLKVDLEHVDGASLQFEVLVKFDTTGLQGPLERDKEIILAALQEQIDLILRMR